MYSVHACAFVCYYNDEIELRRLYMYGYTGPSYPYCSLQNTSIHRR